MTRLISAVLLGYALTGLLIFGTDRVFAASIPGFAAMPVPPAYYFLISILTDTLYSVAGGWLCARIAPADRRAITGLIILGELMGLFVTVTLWGIAPHYYSIALLILYPPAVWLGGRLYQKRS